MTTTESNSRLVESSLARPDIHQEWESRYRESDVRRMQEESLERVIGLVRARPGAFVLDVGCGSGFNAIHLTRLGFQVLAVDFSEVVLANARAHTRTAGFDDRIDIDNEDLTALSLHDSSADHVLCWGVLMHIPAVEAAVSELSRVLRPGGALIVCEGNMHALDELALRVLDRFGRTVSRRRMPAGTERWRQTPAGPLLARRADIGWLIRAFEARGLVLEHRIACQLTEAYVYTRSGSRARRAIQAVNRLWFRRVRTGRLASDNFLIFRKAR